MTCLRLPLAVTLAVSLAAPSMSAILAEDVAPPSTGVAECDEYYGMASSCLSRMCETEGALAELDLSFSREVLAKVMELKGREAAAEACVHDALKEIQNDPYGCYETQRAKAGLPAARIRAVRVAPSAGSVTISFESDGPPPGAALWEVEIVSNDLEPGVPSVRYQVPSSNGVFVLNTAVERPMPANGGPAQSAPPGGPVFSLEPGMSYCFSIESPTGEERRGTFTTSAGH